MAERALFLQDIRGALGVTSVQERSPKQFPEVFSQPDVDGGLIGGASLNSSEFLSLCSIAMSA